MTWNQYSLDLERDSSQYSYFANSSTFNATTYTIEAWIKIESSPGAFMEIFSKDSGAGTSGYSFYLTSGLKLELIHEGVASKTGTATLTTGKWYHVACVYNGTTVQFYLNGATDGSAQALGNNLSSTASQRIGGWEGTAGTFDGLISNIRYFNDARTQQEIQDNMYSILTGTDNNLVGSWYNDANDHNDDAGSNNLTASGSPVFSTNVPWTGANSTDWTSYQIASDNTKVSGSSDHTDIPLLIKDGNLSAGVYSGVGVCNYAIDLELSSSQYAYCTDNAALSLTGDFTIEAWVKLEQLPSTAASHMTILSKYDYTGSDREYLMQLRSDDTIRIYYSSDGTNATYIPSTSAIVTSADVGKWIHIAGSVDVSAKTGQFYKMGATVATSAGTGTQTSGRDGTSNLVVGANDEGRADFMDGKLSNVRLWSDIRTQAEIIAGLNEVYTGTANNLVGSWYNNDNDSNDNAGTNNLTTSGSPTISSADTPIPDLRFTTDSAGTTEVPFEIVSLDKVNTTAEIWVKYPTLSYNTDSDLYVWYGNSSAAAYDANAPFGSQAVWSDYSGVWHFETLTADSTANARTLTNNNSVTNGTGQIGNSADMGDQSGSIKTLSIASSLHDLTGTWTYGFWVNPNVQPSTDTDFYIVDARSTTGTGRYQIIKYVDNGGTKQVELNSGGTLTQIDQTLSTDTWYYYVVTKTSTTVEAFINGSSIGTGSFGTTANATSRMALGASAGDLTTQPSKTEMDEFHIRTSLLSDDWITTEYNNQNDPSTFWKVGGVRRYYAPGIWR